MSTTKSLAEKKQSKILEVATNLFLERGYHAVSLDDILDRVGGSKTTLYSYYGGKEGLFSAIIQASVREKLARLQEVDVANLDPKAGLTKIGRVFLSAISERTGESLYRIMIAEAERFPQLASEFYAAGPQLVIKLIKGNLETWQKKGLLRPGDSETLAVHFIGIVLGNFNVKALLGLYSPPTEKEMENWIAASVTLFLDGVLPR